MKSFLWYLLKYTRDKIMSVYIFEVENILSIFIYEITTC